MLQIYGDFISIQPANEKVFAYFKVLADSPRLLVILSFTSETTPYDLKEIDGILDSKLILGNYDNVPDLTTSTISLRPYEARLYSLA